MYHLINSRNFSTSETWTFVVSATEKNIFHLYKSCHHVILMNKSAKTVNKKHHKLVLCDVIQ